MVCVTDGLSHIGLFQLCERVSGGNIEYFPKEFLKAHFKLFRSSLLCVVDQLMNSKYAFHQVIFHYSAEKYFEIHKLRKSDSNIDVAIEKT